MRTGTDSTEGRQRETGKSSVAPFISTRELILSFATRKNGGGDRGGGVCVWGGDGSMVKCTCCPTEALGPDLSIHTAAHNLNSSSRRSDVLYWPLRGTRHTCGNSCKTLIHIKYL